MAATVYRRQNVSIMEQFTDHVECSVAWLTFNILEIQVSLSAGSKFFMYIITLPQDALLTVQGTILT
jgi:hypothetical protein